MNTKSKKTSSKKRGRTLNTGSPVQRKRAREREMENKVSKKQISPIPSPVLDRVKPDRLVSLSDESEDSDSESEIQLVHQSNDETIDVSFDFSDFEENDYHGTRNLLTRSIVLDAILDRDNLSELADRVVTQVELGTSVKANDAIFGFATLLKLESKEPSENAKKKKNEKKKKKKGFAQTIKSLLMKKLPERSMLTKLESILNKSVLLVNERVMNFPVQLVPALHDNLHRDLSWACNQDDTEFKSFEYVLVLAPIMQGNKSSRDVHFDKFEEEIMKNASVLDFVFDVPRSAEDQNAQKPKKPIVHYKCNAMFVPRKSLGDIVKKVSTFLSF